MKYSKPIVIFIIALTLLASINPASNYRSSSGIVQADTASEEYVFLRSWGGEGNQFRDPRGVAVGPDGIIYVANTGLNRVVVIHSGERIFTTWGDSGIDPGRFDYPCGISLDNKGFVYVADTYNHRIQKFTIDGVYLTEWGEPGEDPGELNAPSDIAIDKAGNVYVTDQRNHRIQKFSSNGIFLTQWGSEGSSPGQFNRPNGIAIDLFGFVYVADTNNHRIQKFTPEGNYLIQWGGEGESTGKFVEPFDIAVDNYGFAYIADFGNNRIQKFTTDGSYLTHWGSSGIDDGQFRGPMGISVDQFGSVYVTDTFNQRIQKFTSDGTYLTKWGTESTAEELRYPTGIALDKSYGIYVLTYDNRLKKFTTEGTYQERWGMYGVEAGQFRFPDDISVDGFGYVYVTDTENHRIQKFTSDGKYLTQWGSHGEGIGQFDYPYGIAVNKSGFVYVADTYNHRIQKFTSDGTFLNQWGELGGGAGQFFNPYGITVDGSGFVYVADTHNHRIQKFTSDGIYLTQWGSGGNGAGQFKYPHGIAVDESGFVYLADTDNHRIQKFTSNGIYLTQWGSRGSGSGQFEHPDDIVVGESGFVFVVDRDNHRIQVFSEGTPNPDLSFGLTLNGGFESSPALTEWTHGGDLSILQTKHSIQGSYGLQLGGSIPQIEQGIGEAWAHTTFFVRPEMEQPTLSFQYNMFVNDIIDYSDFFVAIQDGVGLNHLETVLRDGYPGNVAPPAGYDMGWRTKTFDLSAYKGQHIRLVFSNRNLWPGSWGIWTTVDDVRVVDASDLPTFTDVPDTHWAVNWIERLYDAGITAGCGTDPLRYCPESQVTRAEMAVFLERGMQGNAYTPASASGSLFADVNASHWAAKWIEKLYADGVTSGCSQNPLKYCPESPVTRAEMAAFLLRAKYGKNYTPPPATGIFADVPTSHWAAGWIEKLYGEGITSGCSQSPLKYCPESPVTRAEMAAFLVRAFELP